MKLRPPCRNFKKKKKVAGKKQGGFLPATFKATPQKILPFPFSLLLLFFSSCFILKWNSIFYIKNYSLFKYTPSSYFVSISALLHNFSFNKNFATVSKKFNLLLDKFKFL